MTTNRIKAIVAIADWQQTHNPARPYRLHELMRALRIDSATAAFALKLNGWHRDRMRETRMNRRQLTQRGGFPQRTVFETTQARPPELHRPTQPILKRNNMITINED